MNNNFTLYILSDNGNEYHQLDVETSQMTTIYSLQQINDITKRMDTFSQDVILKGTDRNNIALGNLYDIGRYSNENYTQELAHNFTANKAVKCILLENNIQIVKGSLLIRNINIDNNTIVYDAVITGNLVTFFTNLKDRFLHELDSIQESAIYNSATVQDSWIHTALSSKFVLPSVDYGIDDRQPTTIDDVVYPVNNWDNTFDFKNYRFGLYVKTYLDAMMKGFRYDEEEKYTQLNEDGTPVDGYTYNSTLLTTDPFTRLFIPYQGEQMIKTETKRVTEYKDDYTFPGDDFFLGNSWTMQFNPNKMDSEFFTTKHIPNFKNDPEVGMTIYNYYTLKSKDPYLKTSVRIVMDLTLPVDWRGQYKVGLYEVTNYNEMTDTFKFFTTINKTTQGLQTFHIDYISDIQNVAGEYMLGVWRDDRTKEYYKIDTPIRFENVEITWGGDNIISEVPYVINDEVKLFDVIPRDVKLQDFFKSILNLFNLYIIINPENDNEFIIEPYDEFYKDIIQLNVTDTNNNTDWTDKFDFENYKISTNINLPKSYIYKFAEDSDMLNDEYKNSQGKGYGDLTVNDSKGTGDNKEIEIIFAPTANIQQSQDTKKLACLYKADGLIQGNKKPFKSKLRLLYNNGRTTDSTIYRTYYRNEEYGIRTNIYCYASMFRVNNNIITDTLCFDLPTRYYTFDDIVADDYSITTYNKFHKTQIEELIDENIVYIEIKAYLTENDIANLNFRKPIFLQTTYGNGYFKLIEVIYTNTTTATTIKLQKIIK